MTVSGDMSLSSSLGLTNSSVLVSGNLVLGEGSQLDFGDGSSIAIGGDNNKLFHPFILDIMPRLSSQNNLR